ncbi:hypothetical protein CLF_109946 [Clonorchis sinensis]|uniref:Uncharacterized protein n=1 Tax=Clonorchis sinensis TaxID=79923 RepID=G7YK09_CLOSI|nr:hypothetical protein CLF_109946 [Clonorchis sinensis]
MLLRSLLVHVEPPQSVHDSVPVYGPTWLPGLRCVERNNRIRCQRGNDFDKREYDQAFFSGYGKIFGNRESKSSMSVASTRAKQESILPDPESKLTGFYGTLCVHAEQCGFQKFPLPFTCPWVFGPTIKDKPDGRPKLIETASCRQIDRGSGPLSGEWQTLLEETREITKSPLLFECNVEEAMRRTLEDLKSSDVQVSRSDNIMDPKCAGETEKGKEVEETLEKPKLFPHTPCAYLDTHSDLPTNQCRLHAVNQGRPSTMHRPPEEIRKISKPRPSDKQLKTEGFIYKG